MRTRNGTSRSGRCRANPETGGSKDGQLRRWGLASEKHDVLVQDEAGETLLAATFAHDEQGIRSLCGALVRLKVERVAIERPDGGLIERLLDAGVRAVAL